MRFLAGDLGKNGVCDQHHADWNDGLEATKEAGARESVFVTRQFFYRLREMVEIARLIGDPSVAREAVELYTTFKNRINEVCWDGEWYTRTHCGDGYVIGSKNCTHRKTFVNSQSCAGLYSVASGERAQTSMRKVDEILENDIGYRICYPPQTDYDARVGSMSKSMPGANENGVCYNHAGGPRESPTACKAVVNKRGARSLRSRPAARKPRIPSPALSHLATSTATPPYPKSMARAATPGTPEPAVG